MACDVVCVKKKLACITVQVFHMCGFESNFQAGNTEAVVCFNGHSAHHYRKELHVNMNSQRHVDMKIGSTSHQHTIRCVSQ